MNKRSQPVWEREVRWTDDGLPFDLRPLRYVLAAAERLSFSQAGIALGISTSSISRQIRDFEDNLGVSLFERNTTGVRLTDAGYRLACPAMSTS